MLERLPSPYPTVLVCADAAVATILAVFAAPATALLLSVVTLLLFGCLIDPWHSIGRDRGKQPSETPHSGGSKLDL